MRKSEFASTTATVTDGFPLMFTDSVLDTVASHECYSFLDGFSGYNQIRMHLEDKEKTTFVTEWGVFMVEVMMLGLKTVPTTRETDNRHNLVSSLHHQSKSCLVIIKRYITLAHMHTSPSRSDNTHSCIHSTSFPTNHFQLH